MKKIGYKKFKDVKEGNILYCVEVSNIDVQFKTTKVREIDTEFYGTKEDPWFYFDDSPISYTVNMNKSNWCNMIFTDKIEALQSAQKQITQKIKYFSTQTILFSNYLQDIQNNNIEFKNE